MLQVFIICSKIFLRGKQFEIKKRPPSFLKARLLKKILYMRSNNVRLSNEGL